MLMKHAYSTLLDVDNEGKVVPDLAESYEMKSDTEYVFNSAKMPASGTALR